MKVQNVGSYSTASHAAHRRGSMRQRSLLQRFCPFVNLLYRIDRSRLPAWKRLLLLLLLSTIVFLLLLIIVLLYSLFTMPFDGEVGVEEEMPLPDGIKPERGSQSRPSAQQIAEDAMLEQFWANRRVYRPPYWSLEQRRTPRMRKAVLEALFSTPPASVAEQTLLLDTLSPPRKGAVADHEKADDDDDDFYDAVFLLLPPKDRMTWNRRLLNKMSSFGPRVAGTAREELLQFLTREGLGRHRYDPEQLRFLSAPHLSKQGQEVLEAALQNSEAKKVEGEMQPGWHWTLEWDNFTTKIPVPISGHRRGDTVEMQNLVFHFPGGPRFQEKSAAAAATTLEGPTPNSTTAPPSVGQKKYLLEEDEAPHNYTQECFVRLEYEELGLGGAPSLVTGPPGTRAVLSLSEDSVLLKPSLSAAAENEVEPATQQPVRHAVLAAHWDSKYSPKYPFIGASDSLVPILFLLRTIKSIALLSDVAAVLTASYAAEVEGAEPSVAIPGRTATFHDATTEEEVKTRLATLVSPALHALLYRYFFAAPHSLGGKAVTDLFDILPTDSRSYPAEQTIDVRRWLDWVQHLPAISVLLFDGEEAFGKWDGDDNTYGSRHLARKWRQQKVRQPQPTSEATRLSQIDLFALYDLMGPVGTQFQNIYPTQSGVYFSALAQQELELRHRALSNAVDISSLLWRCLNVSESHCMGGKATATRLKQLFDSQDAALAQIDAGPHRETLLEAAADAAVLRSGNQTADRIPLSWIVFGSPHEMGTLHGLAREVGPFFGVRDLRQYRQYDAIHTDVAKDSTFSPLDAAYKYNRNIFFPLARLSATRREAMVSAPDDDHKHWLDTQRVLHLIPTPFPQQWHTVGDTAENIDDGTMLDLGQVLWSATLDLGNFWLNYKIKVMEP